MRGKITKCLLWVNIIGYVITVNQFFIVGDRSLGTIIGAANIILSIVNFILVKSFQIKQFVIGNNPFTEEICTPKVLFKRGVVIYVGVCLLIIVLCLATDSLILGLFQCLGMPIIFMCFTIYISIIDEGNMEKYYNACHGIQLVPLGMFLVMARFTSTSSLTDFLGIIFCMVLFYVIVYGVTYLSFAVFREVINDK